MHIGEYIKEKRKLFKITAAIPEINWLRGHSGELLSADIAARLHKLWTEGLSR